MNFYLRNYIFNHRKVFSRRLFIDQIKVSEIITSSFVVVPRESIKLSNGILDLNFLLVKNRNDFLVNLGVAFDRELYKNIHLELEEPEKSFCILLEKVYTFFKVKLTPDIFRDNFLFGTPFVLAKGISYAINFKMFFFIIKEERWVRALSKVVKGSKMESFQFLSSGRFIKTSEEKVDYHHLEAIRLLASKIYNGSVQI